MHEGGGVLRLKAYHSGEFGTLFVLEVLTVALPVGSDVPRVSYRESVNIGAVSEFIDYLKRRCLLPF